MRKPTAESRTRRAPTESRTRRAAAESRMRRGGGVADEEIDGGVVDEASSGEVADEESNDGATLGPMASACEQRAMQRMGKAAESRRPTMMRVANDGDGGVD
ncbi:hypothetical protein Syun_001121 [Stephania yunnanensis]|uniref:Uncharacterized protein n=1 Tax=Stephania yunnanensis TaxID=152371 RepID=A0AAP0LDC1_9MAGN